MGSTDRRGASHQSHRVEVGPVLVGQTDRSEVTADLETSDEVADGQLGGIGGGKNVVEGREVWLGKVLLAGEDELVGP